MPISDALDCITMSPSRSSSPALSTRSRASTLRSRSPRRDVHVHDRLRSFLTHNIFYVSGSKFPHPRQRNPIGGLWKGLHNPFAALIVAYLIWGVAAPVSKVTLTEVGPFTLLFFRTVIASLILLPFGLKYRYSFTFREQTYVALSAIFSIFIHITLLYIALPLIPSINAPIIALASPLILVLTARIFLHERVSVRKYIGMGVGLIGVFCITVVPSVFVMVGDVLGLSSGTHASLNLLGLSQMDLSPASIMWVGNALLVLGVVFGAVGPLFLKPIRRFPAQLITFWQFALVACFTLPFALLETPRLALAQLSPAGIAGILYVSVLSSVVAYSLHTHALQEEKVADVAIFSYLSPISALLVGVPLLHEYPDWWFIIGSVLVLAGLWIAEKQTRARLRKAVEGS